MAATRASGHDRRALRHDARDGARTDRSARRRPRHPHRRPRAQVGGRLRPDAPVRRIGGHARCDHGRDRAPARPADAVAAAVCAFDSMEGAVQTVITTMQLGIPVARIELLDEVQMDAVNRYSRLRYAVQPTLLFEFHGTSEAGVTEHARAVQETAGRARRRRLPLGDDHRGPRDAVAGAAQHAVYAALALRPGAQGLGDRRLRADLRARRTASSRHGATCRRPRWWRRSSVTSATATSISTSSSTRTTRVNWPRCAHSMRRLVQRALALGGTCTGEHGIGMRQDRLPERRARRRPSAVMKAIKHALDPDDRMNPGKMFR